MTHPSEKQFLAAQLLHPLDAARALEILGETSHAVDVLIEKMTKNLDIGLGLQPAAQMVLIREILVGHVAGITAERHLAHGIDTEKGNDRPARIAANLVAGNEPLAGDDELP